jgi:Flp pilus assembly protein TadD
MWFRLGICGLATEDWAIAQRGFARVTALFPDDGEAWSNLATSFIRQSKLKEAYTALKEALRHSAENWRIWDNFVIICMVRRSSTTFVPITIISKNSNVII